MHKIIIPGLRKKKTVLQYSLLCISFVAGLMHVSAQQQSLHTMFMFNKLLVNPAYAGYHEHPCATAHIREQWMGFTGAPKTQSLSFHAPLSSKEKLMLVL